MQKLRVSGEYLKTAAVLQPGGAVPISINDGNGYLGASTGYHLSTEWGQEIVDLPQAVDLHEFGMETEPSSANLLQEIGEALPGNDTDEIIIALGLAFGTDRKSPLLRIPHERVLRVLIDGIEVEGYRTRVVKIYATSDCGFIGHGRAHLSGSGIAIGLQSKGIAMNHHRDLEPLNNLELLPHQQAGTLRVICSSSLARI